MEPSRERVEPAARDRLGSPLDPLAALEDGTDRRVGLQDLEQVVRVEPGIAVVEADDHPDRHHVVAHRVDERAAELAVLRLRAQRPAHGVDHAVERPRDLPHLLHAELPHLRRRVTAETEVVERDVGEVSLRAFGEHGHPGDEVTARLEVAQLLAVRGRGPCRRCARRRHGPARRAGAPPRSRGRNIAPSDSARSASQRPSCDSETMTLPWLRIGGGVGIGSARLAREHVHLLLADRAVGRHAVETTVALEQPLAAHRAGSPRPTAGGSRAACPSRRRRGARRPAVRRRRGAPRAAARSGSRTRAPRARRRRRARRPRCARRSGSVGSTTNRLASNAAAKSTGRDISRRACAAARRARARSRARRPRRRDR